MTDMVLVRIPTSLIVESGI